jgi:hypothetical protein
MEEEPMTRRAAALPMAMALMGAGLWFGQQMGTIQAWLLGAGLVGLVGVATEIFLGRRSETEPAGHLEGFSLWIAPGLLVAAGVWLARAILPGPNLPLVAAAGLTMGLLLLALRTAGNADSPHQRLGRFGANLLLFLAVFLLFASIHQTDERGLVTAMASGVVALLGGLELIRPRRGDLAGWSLVAVPPLVIAQTAWALTYWPVSGPVAGALLLLTFYVLSGLAQAVRQGGIGRRSLLEYGAVGTAGLAAVLWSVPW